MLRQLHQWQSQVTVRKKVGTDVRGVVAGISERDKTHNNKNPLVFCIPTCKHGFKAHVFCLCCYGSSESSRKFSDPDVY